MSDQVLHQLKAYLAQQHPEAVVSEFSLLSGGWECDIYAFKLIMGDQERDLILRLFLGADGAEKTQRENVGMRRLYQAGYPVPELFLSETDARFLGNAFIIMERFEGQSLWRVMASSDSVQEEQLLNEFGRLVANLHQLDWAAFTDNSAVYQERPIVLLDDWIGRSRQLYHEFGFEGFLKVSDWLDAHKQEISTRPAVVHLDLHANNVLIDAKQQMKVIDWSQISVADYRCDLSWTLMIMGDHGLAGWYDKILASYELSLGHSVDYLDYFNVMSYVKLLANTVISMKVGTEKLGLRPQDEATRQEQMGYLRKLSQRLYDIVGFDVPEVQMALNQ